MFVLLSAGGLRILTVSIHNDERSSLMALMKSRLLETVI